VQYGGTGLFSMENSERFKIHIELVEFFLQKNAKNNFLGPELVLKNGNYEELEQCGHIYL
jgi:hypothetical protein